MKIQIGEYCIRSYRRADLAAMVKYGDNPLIAANMTDAFPHPYTDRAARDWLDIVLDQDREVLFALANEHELVGSIGLQPGKGVYRCMAEIGYWVGEEFWGRGIVSAAVVALTDFAFAQFEEIARIQAHVFSSNPASARVLEKAGYDLEGRLRRSVIKNGELLDQWMYAKVR